MSQLIPRSPLQTRAAFFLSKAYARINSDTKTKVSEFSLAFRNLIDSIGWSALRVRPMLEKELPYADDYQNMIDETRNDVQVIHSSIPQLAQQGLSIANYGEAQKLYLNEAIAVTDAKVKKLASKANKELRGHFIGVGEQSVTVRQKAELFIENFDNSNNINMSNSKNIFFDQDNASVTLQRSADVDHSKSMIPFVDIFIGNELIGLPGNTVEVNSPNLSATGTSYTPMISFVGETALNGNPNSMIDSNPDTIFEFERLALISETQPIVKNGDAFLYSDTNGTVQQIQSLIAPDDWSVVVSSVDEGKQKTQTFPKTGLPASYDGKGLICDITLFFAESKPINIIEIDPYIPTLLKGIPITVESITVFPEIGPTVHVDVTRYTNVNKVDIHTTGEILNRSLYFLPKTIVAREIKIILRQLTAYETYAGHNFIVATVETNKQKSILGFTYSNKTTISKPRLKNQDEQYIYNRAKTFDLSKAALAGAAIGTFFGPGGTAIGAAIGWIVGTLFGSKSKQTVLKVEKGVDVFKARRWQVGIRNITAKQIRYEKSGTFVSNPIKFSNPIINVTVKPSMKYSLDNGTLVTFDVSPDNGSTWLPVDVTTNMLTPFDKPTSSVVVRANMLQSDSISDNGLTPIIYGYSLEGYS